METQTFESPSIIVQTLAGRVVACVCPVPETIDLLKVAIEAQCGIAKDTQQLTHDLRILKDSDVLKAEPLALTLVVDESPLLSWDIAGNPNCDLLEGDGCIVRFVEEDFDYVNVVTVKPVSSGIHWFEFVMHQIGDEQWCGVTHHKSRAGYHGTNEGLFYYCGRRWHSKAGLHAPREHEKRMSLDHVKTNDIIGTLIDMDRGALVFTLNGVYQVAVAISKEPLYLTTSLDKAGDCVELRKAPPAEAPPEAWKALQGTLLEVEPALHETSDVGSMATLSSDEDMTAPPSLNDMMGEREVFVGEAVRSPLQRPTAYHWLSSNMSHCFQAILKCFQPLWRNF